MDLSLSEFQRKIGPRAREERKPLACLFEITPTCNLRCHFCYVALDPYKGPYLSTEQVYRVLDTIFDAGVLWLTLTGGEIFSRRDFPQIYRYARNKGFLVTLYTNATMANERIADLLRELPPFSSEVSIYGANAEVYEGTTGIPGSFARFERGMELLLAAGLRPLMKTPLTPLTEDHVPELVAWCHARDLPLKLDTQIDYRHDGKGDPSLYRLEPRRRAAVNEVVQEMKAITFRPPPSTDTQGASRQGPLPECEDIASHTTGQLYQCSAGRVSFFVDALGNMSHCVIDRDPAFPILEMPWDDIWDRIGTWVTQPLPAEAPCSSCGMRKGCVNCPARARLATGSSYLKDPYICDVTHDRYGQTLPMHPDYRAMARQLGSCVARN